jgi:hypothetical protein
MAVVLPLTSAHATTVSCGQVITTDVRLTADLNCSGSALTIGASDVAVDLAGHSITGDGSGQAIEVYGTNSDSTLINITVRDGTINNFASGIDILFAQTVRLSHLVFDQNGSEAVPTSGALSMGIGARDVRLDRSLLKNSSPIAVNVHNGTGLTMTRTTILGGSVSLVNSLQSTTISDSSVHQGVIFSNQSNNILLDRDILIQGSVEAINTFTLTVRHSRISGGGVNILGEDRDVLVTRNVFTDNNVGVLSAPFPGTIDILRATISRNLFIGNDTAGVWLEGRTGGAPTGTFKVIGNKFVNNGHRADILTDVFGNTVNDGLHIDTAGPSGVVVAGNHTSGNADHGIEAQPGSVIDGGGNTSHNDPQGCLGVICS